MTVKLRINSGYMYRGIRFGKNTYKTFDSLDHARAYARKVIKSEREGAQYRRTRHKAESARVNSVTLLPEEGLSDGLEVHRWTPASGWHRAVATSRFEYNLVGAASTVWEFEKIESK